MGRNLEENVYIEVPFKKDSWVLARLKEEAAQAQNTRKRVAVGPFIAELLEKRYRDEAAWSMKVTPESLSEVVEKAVRTALAGLPLQELKADVVNIEVAHIEIDEANIADLADDFGGDDDWGTLEE
jgi:hypothetical protein